MDISTSLRALLLLSLLLSWPPAAPTMAQTGSRQTFRDFGYGDLTARAMFGSLDYFFPVPRGQLPRSGSQLELVVSHSPLLVPDRSTLTVVANGQSVTSVLLTPENRNRARIVVPLPADGFSGNGYFIQIQFALRLTRDECEETQNPALWATVHGDSSIVLATQLSERGPTLADLPGLYAPPTAATSDTTGTVVVLPASPSAEEVEAAGLVAFQLGRWSAGTDPNVQAATSAPAHRGVILVGTGSSLAPSGTWGDLSWNGQSYATTGGPIPPEHGVLAVSRSVPARLLVSGGTPTAVREAATTLVRSQRRALLAGEHTIVTGQPVAFSSSSPWQAGAASFAQLGVERRQVTGPGEHTTGLELERPAGWRLLAGSALELAIETSAGLRSETSWVAVSLNGLDLGSRRLERTGQSAASGRYRFELPFDRLNSDLDGRPAQQLTLQIRLHLDLAQAGCAPAAPLGAWAVVLPTSTWLLPHERSTALDLAQFPAPLAGPTDAAVTVVLPNAANESERTSGLRVMAALGRRLATEPATLPRLALAASVTEDERKQRNLILIGRPDRNALSAAAPALFEASVPAAYRLTPGERRGELRLATSPFSGDRVVLAIMGEDAPSVELAATTLTRRAQLEQLRGRSVVIVEALPPQTVVGAEPAAPPAPSLAPRIETPPPPTVPAWQLVGAVTLGAFVALVILFVLIRLRGRRA